MDGPRMRKINGKLFLALLVGAFVLTGSVFAVHQLQYRRIASALLWQARRAEEQGDAARQAKFLQRYLEFNPRDTAEKATLARVWTGDAFADRPRERRRAVRLLDEVLTLNKADDPELRRLLVRTALDVRDVRLARDHLSRLLPWADVEAWVGEERAATAAARPLPDRLTREDRPRGELECFWGQMLEEEQKPAEAVACYRLARRHAPDRQLSYVRLAYLLRRTPESDPRRREKNHTEADAVIDELVRRNDSSFEAYLARWKYRHEFDLLAVREAPRGQVPLETAAEDIAQALKRKPKSVEVLLAAAALERLRGRAAAEDTRQTPEQRRAGLKRHRDRAEEYLRRGLELTGKTTADDYGTFQLLWHKGNLLLDDLEQRRARRAEEGQPPGDDTPLKSEIREVIDRVATSRIAGAADYMRGRLCIHEREWARAASLFERARTLMAAQPDFACQADLYLGQCYERLEEHAQMLNAYKRVANFDATSVQAMLGMAAARWAQGQLDEALAHYQTVMKQKRVPPRGWIDIARLQIQRQAQREKPDWAAAESALDEAEKVNPGKAMLEVRLLRAEVLLRRGKPDDARALLTEARDANPTEVDYWVALADLELRQRRPAEARVVLDAARAKVGDRVGLRLAEARLLASANQGTAIGKLAENRGGFNEEDQARLLSGLADALLRAGRPAEARRLWQALAGLPARRNDLRLRLLLFDLAMRDGDEAGMRAALEEVRGVEHAGGAYHRYGQALLLIWQAKKAAPGPARKRAIDQARAELGDVLRLRPSWAPVYLARAEIAELHGNPEQAIKDLQEATKAGEASPAVLRRLVTLLSHCGRDAEADLLLGRLKEAVRRDTDLQRLQVALEVRRGQADRAVESARQLVRDDTRDPQELVWMARVLFAARKLPEAEAKLRQAVAVANGDPLPWVALVQFLVEQRRQDEARKVIAEAKKKLPAEKAALPLGRCHDAVGEVAEARKYYERALATGGKDPAVVKGVAAAHLAASRAAEAEPLLRRLVAGQLNGANPADVAWARRALATILAGGTDYRRFREALELVGLRLDAEGRLVRDNSADEGTENRRTRARVLASQNQRQFRRQAIDLLEGLKLANALSPDDQFILAILHDAEGNTRKSRDQLELLTRQREQTPPQYLAQYALGLIVQRRTPADLDQAERVVGWLAELERLRQVGPNTFASVALRARLLEVRGKGDEAIALLRTHVGRAGARPEEVILVLESLLRLRRYRDAYELCEKTWADEKCAAEVVGGMSVAVLGAMTPSPSDAQAAAVERRLQAALQKRPTSAVLKMHLAQLYDKRGRYEPAEQMYRAVLKQEPNNIVALNNLAWLLVHRDGDATEALAHVNKAVNGMGRRADLLDTRGLVHLALKDTAKAVADLREAAAEAPTPAHLYHLARALHEERNRTRAREVLLQAKEKGLEVARLHPVEQDACRRLLAEYGIR